MPRPAKKQPPRAWYRRKIVLWPLAILLVLVAGLALAFRFSPWPGALVVRTVFNHGGQKTLQAMEAALPEYPVTVLHDQQYRPGDPHAFLDVYMPDRVTKDTTADKLPVVVWTHGGAWLSGDKTNDAPYFKRLANEGYIVIALNYSLAPGARYPTAVHQLNAAYEYILSQADRFHADTWRIILAGDSAGAQLSSQMAAIITSPTYAQEVGVEPKLPISKLVGVILYCGIYKMEGLTHPDPTLPKIVSWGDDITVWSYVGVRDKASPLIRQMSAYYHVESSFPATFISGGNADPLTEVQSKPFAQKLSDLRVPVTEVFFPRDHQPALPHEYQFTFNKDGEKSFTAMLAYLRQVTARSN